MRERRRRRRSRRHWQRPMEAARHGHRVGHASADQDQLPGAGRRTPSNGWRSCCAPATSRSGSSPTAAGGRWSGRRAAARPGPRSGTRPCSARNRRPCRRSSRCSARSRFQAEAARTSFPPCSPNPCERQEEVTEQLGRQVREAVELLITTLDQLDRESNGALLAGVSDDDFYAGVVTVMMRVVFLLFAEERRLLPSDDDLYVTAYSVGHLVEQLEQQDSLGAVLRERTAAWHRLLAVTRAVYSGVAHEDLRLPAYGGGLFDPDRYPWLEGRPTRRRPPPRRARRGRRPDRAADAARRPVRGDRRRAPPAHLPRPGRGTDRLRLRGPARTGGPHRHRNRARPGAPEQVAAEDQGRRRGHPRRGRRR